MIGLGYVGLPLLKAVVDAGFGGVGLDIDPRRTAEAASRRPVFRSVASVQS